MRCWAGISLIFWFVSSSSEEKANSSECELDKGSISDSPIFDSGTIFLWPELITSDDKTVYTGNVATGQRTVTMFSRLEGWITVPAWTFDASFEDLATVECCVNANEYSQTFAQALCDAYLPDFGRIPNEVRNHWGHLGLWVMAGDALAGGGSGDGMEIPALVLLHEEYANRQLHNKLFEELILHELTHASFPKPPNGYLCSVNADQICISPYARELIVQEDLAETMCAWVGVTFRRDRLTEDHKYLIEYGIPQRLAFLSRQGWNMYPLAHQDISSGYVFSSIGTSADSLDLPLTYERTGESHGRYPMFQAKEKESVLFVDNNGYWGTATKIGPYASTAWNSAWPTPQLPPEYGWVFIGNAGSWEEDLYLHMSPYTSSGYVFSSTGTSSNSLGLPLTYERTGETHGGYPVFEAKEKESVLFVDNNGYWATATEIGPYAGAAWNSALPTPQLPPVYGWVFAGNAGWEEDPYLHMSPYGQI